MKISTRVFIGSFIAAIVLTISLLAFGAWQLSRLSALPESTEAPNAPAEIRELRVVSGADFLTKREFFKLKKLSYWQILWQAVSIPDDKRREQKINSESFKGVLPFAALEIGEFDGEAGLDVAVAGRFGVQMLDANGNLKREILLEPSEKKIKIGWYTQSNFSQHADNFQIFDLEADGKTEFLSTGITEGVTVYGANGKILWNFGGENEIDVGKMMDEKEREAAFEKTPYVRGASVGDLNGDGLKEILVSQRIAGIRAFDHKFQEKWQQPDDFPSENLIIFDFDGDGKNEILEPSGARGKILDANGKILRDVSTVKSYSRPLFAPDKKAIQFFYVSDGKITLLDFAGKELLTTDAPLSKLGGETENSIYAQKAAWVTLIKNQPKFLAVIGGYVGHERSQFYLYDANGKPVYQEILPERCETLAVLPAAENGAEAILIGGKKTIWHYGKTN